jgi:hypothetical protein
MTMPDATRTASRNAAMLRNTGMDNRTAYAAVYKCAISAHTRLAEAGHYDIAWLIDVARSALSLGGFRTAGEARETEIIRHGYAE